MNVLNRVYEIVLWNAKRQVTRFRLFLAVQTYRFAHWSHVVLIRIASRLHPVEGAYQTRLLSEIDSRYLSQRKGNERNSGKTLIDDDEVTREPVVRRRRIVS